YIRILSAGLWPWMAFECLRRFVQANTQMRLPAVVLAGAALLHLVCHWAFVWRRFEHASFTAVAWISVATYWAMFIGLAACTLHWDVLRPAWSARGTDALVSAQFYALAVPAMIEACGEYMAFEFLTMLATYLGPASLAAQAVVFSSMSMVYQLPHGLGAAAAVRIGQQLGRGDSAGAQFSAMVLAAGGLAYSLLGTAFFVFCGRWWVTTYTQDPGVVDIASRLVLVAATIEWADATRGIVPGILRGMGKQRRAASINIGAYYFVALPLAALAVLVLDACALGLWVAFAVGMYALSGSYLFLVARADWAKE
ncbi:ethionine resistance protein, partial [Coemansia spiralis]